MNEDAQVLCDRLEAALGAPKTGGMTNLAPRLALEPLDDGGAEELEASLREAIRVTPEALEEEFVRTPTDIAWWTARHARAIGEHLRAEAKRKRLYGFLRIRARQQLEAAAAASSAKADKDDKKPEKGKAVTESMVDSRVEQDPEYQDALEDEIAAEVERERLKGAVAALMCKKDMLVQLGANQRAELERDPNIRERQRAGRGAY